MAGGAFCCCWWRAPWRRCRSRRWFVLPALFVTFPFWVWALDGAERRPGLGRLFGPAFRIGFAFGWGYFTVAFHWLGAAFFLEGGLFLRRSCPSPFWRWPR